MPLPKSAELFFGLPLTDEQRSYTDSIFDYQLTVIDAEAGTGKTTVAVGCAKLLGKGLNYIFAPVADDMGFLPGDLQEKSKPYLQPLIDALEEIGEDPKNVIYDQRLNDFMNSKAWVRAMPHSYLRGSNFKHGRTTIIDEAQNFTLPQLRKILTRVKDGKVIMIGNQKQCDIGIHKSGFPIYYEFFKNRAYANYPQLTHNFRGQLAKDADSI